MLSKISWPTAAVLIASLGVWVTLIVLGKPVPVWMAAGIAMVGKVLLSALPSLLSGGDTGASGGGPVPGSGPKTPTTGNGPTPPAAARRRLEYGPRRSGVFAVLAIAVGSLGLCCTNGVPNPQTVTDTTIGLNAAVCVLTTYTADRRAGKSEGDAILDCAAKCGVTAVQASGLLDAHRAAEVSEGFVLPPAKDGGQ